LHNSNTKKKKKKASFATLAENRFGQKFKIHKVYDNEINYFDEHELLEPICSEPSDAKQSTDNIYLDESDLEENDEDDDSEEDMEDEVEDEEYEGEGTDLADNGKPSEIKSCTCLRINTKVLLFVNTK
jgi:hypothetical protein